MSQWGKSSKNLAAPAAAVDEVPVQKVQKIEKFEKIEVLNLVSTKRTTQPPAPADGAGKANSPRSDDINKQAEILIKNTRNRWHLDHKYAFRATGRR